MAPGEEIYGKWT